MLILIGYLLAVNGIGWFLMRYDKSQARRRRRRTPEKTLFAVAAIGGAAGCWIGMSMFRHKTKHKSFVIGIPALLIANCACIYYLVRWTNL